MSFIGNKANKIKLKDIKFNSLSRYWPARPEDSPSLLEIPCAAVVDEIEANIAKVRYIDPINHPSLCGKTKWLTRSDEQVGDIVSVFFVRKTGRLGDRYYAPMLKDEKCAYDAKRIEEDEKRTREYGPIINDALDDDIDIEEE